MAANNLMINADKTHLVIMSTKNLSARVRDIKLKAGNHTIYVKNILFFVKNYFGRGPSTPLITCPMSIPFLVGLKPGNFYTS